MKLGGSEKRLQSSMCDGIDWNHCVYLGIVGVMSLENFLLLQHVACSCFSHHTSRKGFVNQLAPEISLGIVMSSNCQCASVTSIFLPKIATVFSLFWFTQATKQGLCCIIVLYKFWYWCWILHGYLWENVNFLSHLYFCIQLCFISSWWEGQHSCCVTCHILSMAQKLCRLNIVEHSWDFLRSKQSTAVDGFSLKRR